MIEKTSATSCSDMDIKTAAKLTTADLGYSQLKVKQLKVICDLRQRKTFCVAAYTGYGNSLCFSLLPGTFHHLKGHAKKSIVIVVPPRLSLNALLELASLFNMSNHTLMYAYAR